MEAQAKVKISKTSVTLIKGQTSQLKITGTKKKVSWSTSSKKVATVTSKGQVTAKTKGAAKITAKVSGKKYTCKVKVETPKLSKTKLSLYKGKTATLKLSGTSQKVKWSSTNQYVATVTSKGKVKALNVGSSIIYATVNNKKYSCFLTVKSKPVVLQNFTIDKGSLELKIGEKAKIKASGASGTVNWSSTNTSVATVDSNGNVTAKSIGITSIMATCKNGSAICIVQVISDFDAQKAVIQITYTTYRTDQGVIVIIKNNYKYSVRLTVDCLYYASSGLMVGKSSDSCYLLEKGRECALMCYNPYDSNYEDVDYSSYKINLNVEEPYAKGNAAGISYSGNFGADNVMVTVQNHGDKADWTEIAIVFYKNNIPVGYNTKMAKVENPGSTDYLQFSFPHDREYNTIYPDNFKLYLQSSYSYN